MQDHLFLWRAPKCCLQKGALSIACRNISVLVKLKVTPMFLWVEDKPTWSLIDSLMSGIFTHLHSCQPQNTNKFLFSFNLPWRTWGDPSLLGHIQQTRVSRWPDSVSRWCSKATEGLCVFLFLGHIEERRGDSGGRGQRYFKKDWESGTAGSLL
jgi:hypothetical protein